MSMKKIWFLLVSLCLTTPLQAASLDDALRASCRINTTCSGMVYTEDKEFYYVLSAGHCFYYADKTPVKDTYVQFYHTGYESHQIPAKVIWHKYLKDADQIDPETTTKMSTTDLGILKFKKIDLKNYPKPNVVKMATKPATSGDVIYTAGAGGGAWPSAIKGNVFKLKKEIFLFNPRPRPGRSGSGIINEEGKLVGIIIWVLPDHGAALTMDKVSELAAWK